MLSSLLVPLDGSSFARCSLPVACEVARNTGARLHLARVHEVHEPDQLLENTSFQLEGVDMADYDARRRREEEEELEELGPRVEREGGCSVTCAVLEGPVVAALDAYAQEANVDLIVMTTHGRSGLERALMGSVADELVRTTRLPTVLVHPGCTALVLEGGQPVRHLLVPLDGSVVAECVLPAASDLACALGARMTLTHVIAVESVFGPRPVQLLRHRSEQRWARAYLEAVARRIRGSELDVQIHETLGNAPAPTLVDVAEDLDADLIAIGTRGLRGVRRAVHGSVADQLLRLGQRPLLVIRGAEAGED